MLATSTHTSTTSIRRYTQGPLQLRLLNPLSVRRRGIMAGLMAVRREQARVVLVAPVVVVVVVVVGSLLAPAVVEVMVAVLA